MKVYRRERLLSLSAQFWSCSRVLTVFFEAAAWRIANCPWRRGCCHTTGCDELTTPNHRVKTGRRGCRHSLAPPRAVVAQSLLEEKRRCQPAHLATGPDSESCRLGPLKSCKIDIWSPSIQQPHVEVVRRRRGCAVRGVYFGSNCLAGEHVHRVWPDERGGLRTRTIGAGPADGDRLKDSAAISQGVRPVARLFYEPQPLPGTIPICYVAASQHPGQAEVFEFSLKWVAGSPWQHLE